MNALDRLKSEGTVGTSMVDVNEQAVDRWCPDSVITTVVQAAERLRLNEKLARRYARRARPESRGLRATRLAERRSERLDLRDAFAVVPPAAEASQGADETSRGNDPALDRLLGMLDERDKRIQMLESERADLCQTAARYAAQLDAANQRIAYLLATRPRVSDPPPRPFLAF